MHIDYREFLRVLKHQEPGRPVLFEPFMSKQLYERLVWRSGETVWHSVLDRARILIDASRICGFDCATLRFGRVLPRQGLQMETGLIGQAGDMLPPGMCICDLGPGGILRNLSPNADRGRDIPALCTELCDRLHAYFAATAQNEAVKAVIINDITRDKGCALPADDFAQYVSPCYRALLESAHKRGQHAIYIADAPFAQTIERALACGFDGVYYQESPDLPIEACYARWGGKIALLGGVGFAFACREEPTVIHARCDALCALTQNRGYALGTSNLYGEDIPYLGFISFLSYFTSRTNEYYWLKKSR